MISNANYDSMSRRKIELSRHAYKRAQQRAIPQECVPLIPEAPPFTSRGVRRQAASQVSAYNHASP